MVEYNKYDDLKEQQIISNLIHVVSLSDQSQQTAANTQMYFECIESNRITKQLQKLRFNCVFFSLHVIFSTCGATSSQTTSAVSTETHTNVSQTSTYRTRDVNKIESSASADVNISASESAKGRSESVASEASGKSTYGNDDDEPKLWSHSMKSSSTYSHLASARPRQK